MVVYSVIGYYYLEGLFEKHLRNDGVLVYGEFLFWIIFFSVVYFISRLTVMTWGVYFSPGEKAGVHATAYEDDGPKEIILEKAEPEPEAIGHKVKDVNKKNPIMDILSPSGEGENPPP